MLDSGLLGGLIGAGCMACIVISGCCYDRKERVVEWWRKRKNLHQPLLPVTSTNPVFVRSGSKQWKMKELVALK